jgi:thiaminase
MTTLLDHWHLKESFARSSTATPFIQSLSAASLPTHNFNIWLYNDFVYARCWTYFIASLISALPRFSPHPLKPTLISGYNVARKELDVFRSKASQRGLTLPSVPDVSADYTIEASIPAAEMYDTLSNLPDIKDGCREYMRWMTCTLLGETPYHWSTGLAALWMLEKVYCEAMWTVKLGSGFKKLDESTRDFIEWWAKDEFRLYVGTLEGAIDKIREGDFGWKDEEAKEAVVDVLRLEVGFWGMAEHGLSS